MTSIKRRTPTLHMCVLPLRMSFTRCCWFTDSMSCKKWWQSPEKPCLPSVKAEVPACLLPGIVGQISYPSLWLKFNILLSSHQHGCTCSLANITIPHSYELSSISFNCSLKLLISGFVIGCQVYTTSPYCSVTTKLHCWESKWSSLMLDSFDKRFRDYTSYVWHRISPFPTSIT